jgi:hypothetical protein
MAALFANFEVNRQPRWPILSQLLVGSVAVHALAIASALFVPGVRDAFNLASLISDTKFVDKPYERTVIGDDVQLIDLASNKFHYPPGYWAPEAAPVTIPQPPSPGPQFIAQAQPSPAVQPELGPSPSPSPLPSPNITPLVADPGSLARRNERSKPAGSPAASPSPALTTEEAQKQLEKVAAENNVDLPKENEINKKVMKDLAAYALDLRNQGKLDLNQPFEIVIEALLDQNGKLKDAKFTKKAGDPNLVELFGRMISALNDSNFLTYLKPLDQDNPGSKVVFTIKQGETDVLAMVETEASSADSARLLAKGFNALLTVGAQSRAGKDEEMLLRNTSAEPNGKKLVFNFTMPRQAVVDLIKKQLAPEKPS